MLLPNNGLVAQELPTQHLELIFDEMTLGEEVGQVVCSRDEGEQNSADLELLSLSLIEQKQIVMGRFCSSHAPLESFFVVTDNFYPLCDLRHKWKKSSINFLS